MKFIKRLFASALLLVLTLGFVSSAKAMDIRTGQNIRVAKDQQITDEMLVGAAEINIAGIVNNDVIAASSTANISGKVEGDLNLASGTIEVSGEVIEDARLIGGTVKVSGKVNHNLIVVGGTVEIFDTAQILGDAVIYAGTLKLYGNIKGDLRFSGGSSLISGTVDSDVRLNSPEITIGNTAHIKGNLDYTSTNAATIQNGAKIDGQSTYRLSQKQDLFSQKSVASLLISAIAYIILALIFVILLPARVLAISETLKKNCWVSGLLGVAILVLVPIVVLLLLLTIIGAPTAVALLALYLLTLYIAKIFVATQLGRMILIFFDKKKEPNVILSTIVGLIIILVAINLPYIGYAVSLVVNIFGVGVLVLYLYNLRKTAKAFKLI